MQIGWAELVNKMQRDQRRPGTAALIGALFRLGADGVHDRVGFRADNHHGHNGEAGAPVEHEMRILLAEAFFKERPRATGIDIRLQPGRDIVEDIIGACQLI